MKLTSKENLIIGLLIATQAEIQATRDTLLGLITAKFKIPDNEVDAIQAAYKQLLSDAQLAIIGDIKAGYISKNESINDLLNKIFPPSEDKGE